MDPFFGDKSNYQSLRTLHMKRCGGENMMQFCGAICYGLFNSYSTLSAAQTETPLFTLRLTEKVWS
jgi:hypothetical protein